MCNPNGLGQSLNPNYPHQIFILIVMEQSIREHHRAGRALTLALERPERNDPKQLGELHNTGEDAE